LRSATNADRGFSFFCAIIEEGLVLRMLRGEIHAATGTPQLLIGFDCILRSQRATLRWHPNVRVPRTAIRALATRRPKRAPVRDGVQATAPGATN